MGFRLVAIDNANEKDWAALLNILWVFRAHYGLADAELPFRYDPFFFFFPTLYVLMNALGLVIDSGEDVWGVNEIADTLGVNEGLEGEG